MLLYFDLRSISSYVCSSERHAAPSIQEGKSTILLALWTTNMEVEGMNLGRTFCSCRTEDELHAHGTWVGEELPHCHAPRNTGAVLKIEDPSYFLSLLMSETSSSIRWTKWEIYIHIYSLILGNTWEYCKYMYIIYIYICIHTSIHDVL